MSANVPHRASSRPKYVRLDVHQATTVATVREETGRVIARSIVPTEARAIVEFFRGMRRHLGTSFLTIGPYAVE